MTENNIVEEFRQEVEYFNSLNFAVIERTMHMVEKVAMCNKDTGMAKAFANLRSQLKKGALPQGAIQGNAEILAAEHKVSQRIDELLKELVGLFDQKGLDGTLLLHELFKRQAEKGELRHISDIDLITHKEYLSREIAEAKSSDDKPLSRVLFYKLQLLEIESERRKQLVKYGGAKMPVRGSIPADQLKLLVDSIDLVELIGRDIALVMKGNEWWACCPFHGDKNPSLHIRGEHRWHCFSCNQGGTAVDWMMLYHNMSISEAIKYLKSCYLAEHYGIEPKWKREEERKSISRTIEDESKREDEKTLY